MKRMIVLALSLALLATASVGIASAQHLSGNPDIDSTWEWPVHCKKKPLPANASDVAKSRIADRLCPILPPNPCWRAPCDPPPDPCHVLDTDKLRLRCPIPPKPCLDQPQVDPTEDGVVRWWPCPIPPPCPVPLDITAESPDAAGLSYWPCPIPPPPCEYLDAGVSALSWAPCPIPIPVPIPLPCPVLSEGSLGKCPIPPEPCLTLKDGTDYWRCPDDDPKPLPLPVPFPEPLPIPRPTPVPLPDVPGDVAAKL